MNRAKKLLIAVTTIIATAFASAQSYALTTFNVEELGRTPGLIDLSPNFLSIIEFEDAVQSAATGRSDLIQTSVDGNTIILRPTRSAGQTDLIVQVGGRTTMFILRITEQNATPRRYLVTTPAPPVVRTSPLDSLLPLGQSRTSPFGTAASTTQPAESEPEPAPAAAATPPAAEEPAPVTVEAAPAAPAEPEEETSNAVNGTEIPYEFSTTVDVRSSDELVFRYTLTNIGSNTIVNDNGRLSITTENGRPLEYSIIRMNPDGLLNRVNPTKTEYGTIRISNPPSESIQIAWPIVELGPGTTHTIDEIVTTLE